MLYLSHILSRFPKSFQHVSSLVLFFSAIKLVSRLLFVSLFYSFCIFFSTLSAAENGRIGSGNIATSVGTADEPVLNYRLRVGHHTTEDS